MGPLTLGIRQQVFNVVLLRCRHGNLEPQPFGVEIRESMGRFKSGLDGFGLERGSCSASRSDFRGACLNLFLCFGIIGTGGIPAFAGVFYRPTLGRQSLPAEDTTERMQAGRFEVGRLIPSSRGAAAARPDATGTGGAFYRLSMLDAFAGNKQGFLGDLLAVANRQQPHRLNPTQISYLLGVGTRNGPLRIQFNREEHLPIDRSGGSARYWDVRGGVTFEAALSDLTTLGKKRKNRYGGQQTKTKGPTIRGEFGLGYFLHNKSFHARSNQTGRAFMRYEARALLSTPGGQFQMKVDADFLTDRDHKKYSAANMDLTAGIGIVSKQAEVWFERIQSTILDGPGYDHYFALKFVVPFSGRK